VQEPRLDPRAHAPYDRVEDYILEWTDRIWADAAIGAIPRMYRSDVIVRSATGVSVGVEPVVRGSLAKKAAFVDRIGVGEDVVWEARGPSSFVSHHRVLHTGGQQGPWSYGPPLGRAAVSRNLPVCLVEDGLVSEEWVVRDEWAVVEGLGHDPAGIAAAAPADLAPLGDDGLFGRPADRRPDAARRQRRAPRGASGRGDVRCRPVARPDRPAALRPRSRLLRPRRDPSHLPQPHRHSA
jgi:hypothetical protein